MRKVFVLCLLFCCFYSSARQALFMCKICFDLFGSRKELFRHKKESHNITAISNNCEIGRKRLKNEPVSKRTDWSALFVSKIHFSNRCGKFFCNFAGCKNIKGFESLSKLNWHLKNHLGLFECDICGKKWNLRIHKQSHLKDKCEECIHCKRRFCDPNTKRKHIATVHGIGSDGLKLEPFICIKCNQCFVR